jgi:hypothetical protein
MTNISTLLNHSDPVVSNAARQINDLTTMKNEGQISASEYTELCANALELSAIEKDMSDLSRRQTIVDAFQKLASLAGVVSKVI